MCFFGRVSDTIWRECRDNPPSFKHYATKLISSYLTAFSFLFFVLGFGLGILLFWFLLILRTDNLTLPVLIQLAHGG